MQIISNSQNNTNFNAKFKSNANIKNFVQRASIPELVQFNTILKRMENVNDNKIFSLERKAFAKLQARKGIDSNYCISAYCLVEQDADKKTELDSSVYGSLNWISNLLEKIYPKSIKDESRKALETEIFEKMA